ncbi:Crp/Fnr family transcriptional regulator [Aggregatilinea lenta]|uniref:Crp/Fnr family transcriptional regulator n=1 Tax=Aggregatilinea lenta TaxID=913108 RepID=UPI000E5A6158|nr:Crp/Fnr family transcriptional regulator [Aggregatilinea lenta]
MPNSDQMHPAVKLLSSITYLESLDTVTLESVARTAVKRTYNSEQIVFLEGDSSSGFCVVQDGWLKAIKIAPDGREQVLNFLGPGEVFNAVGVFAGDSNPATVIALEPSTIWIIQRDTMLRLLEDHPGLARAVIQDLAGRVLHLIQMVEDLSLRSVEARLARLLLEQTQTDILSRHRWATQAEIASRLGTVPDVINRALRSLAQDGLIKVERHQIQILNKAGLETKAGLDI